MALPARQYHFQQPANDQVRLDDKVDGLYSFDDEHATSMLDHPIMDSDMMQSSVHDTFQKDVYHHGNTVLSPNNSHAWAQQFPTSMPLDMHESNQFLNMQPHMDASHHGNGWHVSPSSGNCTPTSALDLMPIPRLDGTRYMSSHNGSQQHFEHRPQAHTHTVATAVQPHPAPKSGDWMALAQAEVEARPIPKRLRSNSPTRSVLDIHRRDGAIQKKNKRIDIPPERNIQTIDQLIETTKDEEQLKELKAQKRLLRNREAALASRQRKKKHTEDLESKEKGHQTQLSHLEQQVETLTVERESMLHERQVLIHQRDEAQRFIEALQMEKRDMLMKHNEETASLRRKVQILTEQLEAAPAPAMSAAPSSTGFTDFNADMEALNMGTHDWDSLLFMNDSQPDDPTEVILSTPRNEPVKQERLSATHDNKAVADQPVASGLLFMLLLCGAFVASKPASTISLDLPAMPESVRAAAPTVLNNLLSETNSREQPQMPVMPHEPAPSLYMMPPSRSSNRMTQMHRSLTAPTRQQEIDSAFALTNAQYASLTSPGLPAFDEHEPVHTGRTLAHTLAESPISGPENKAEIYTRSLLWEQIPVDVVNQFKELVRDHQNLRTREIHPQYEQH